MAVFIPRDATFGSSPSQVEGKAVWNNDGAELLKAIRGATGAAVSVDPGIQQTILAIMASAAPAVANAINLDLVPVAQRAFSAWPVKSGLSKSLLTLEVGIGGDGKTFEASIINRAPYAGFIDKGRIARRLVFKPGAEAADAMADRILKDLQ